MMIYTSWALWSGVGLANDTLRVTSRHSEKSRYFDVVVTSDVINLLNKLESRGFLIAHELREGLHYLLFCPETEPCSVALQISSEEWSRIGNVCGIGTVSTGNEILCYTYSGGMR